MGETLETEEVCSKLPGNLAVWVGKVGAIVTGLDRCGKIAAQRRPLLKQGSPTD
jgi:hypothetical protein